LLLLILVVLLPAGFYSVYEINSMSTTERLIADVYYQQLDVVLFSLNQYALDVATSWASDITILLNERQAAEPESIRTALGNFLRNHSSITGIGITDTSFRGLVYTNPSKRVSADTLEMVLAQSLAQNRTKIDRLVGYRKLQYRKIEPIQLTDTDNRQSLALVFIAGGGKGSERVVAVVLDERAFIDQVLAMKLREAAGAELVLAVTEGEGKQPVFTTSEIKGDEIRQKKPLWLFPNYYLGISLRGIASIEQATTSRYYRNIFLIILLNTVLIAGIWLVYRTMRRQIELVRLKSDFVSNVSHELRTPLA